MSEGALLRGWAVSLTRHVAVGVLGILWLAMIVRTLNEEEVGALILVIALPSLLGPLLNLGFPLGVSLLAARQTYPSTSVMAWARRTGLQLSGGSVILMALGLMVTRALSVEINQLVVWGLATVPIALFTAMGAAYFQGRRMFGRQAQILVAPVTLTTAATLVLILGGWNPTADTLVRVIIASQAMTAVWVFWQIRNGRADPVSEPAIRREAWTFAWRAYLSEGAAAIRARFDLFLVGMVLGTAAAAEFGTATALAGQVALLSVAAYQVVFPFAAAKSSPDSEVGDDFTPLTARTSVFLTLTAALFMAVLCQPLLQLFYGADFVDGWPVLLAYLPSVVFLSLSRILTADLSGRGEIATVLRISLLATAFGLVTLPIGIIAWGTTGAAIAATVTALFNTGLRFHAYHVLTGTALRDLILPRGADFTMIARAMRRQPSPASTTIGNGTH